VTSILYLNILNIAIGNVSNCSWIISAYHLDLQPIIGTTIHCVRQQTVNYYFMVTYISWFVPPAFDRIWSCCLKIGTSFSLPATSFFKFHVWCEVWNEMCRNQRVNDAMMIGKMCISNIEYRISNTKCKKGFAYNSQYLVGGDGISERESMSNSWKRC